MRTGPRFQLAYILGCYAAGLAWVVTRYLHRAELPAYQRFTSAEWVLPLFAPAIAPFYAFLSLSGSLVPAVQRGELSQALPELLIVGIFSATFCLSMRFVSSSRTMRSIPIALYFVIAAGIVWCIVLVAQWRAVGPTGTF